MSYSTIRRDDQFSLYASDQSFSCLYPAFCIHQLMVQQITFLFVCTIRHLNVQVIYTTPENTGQEVADQLKNIKNASIKNLFFLEGKIILVFRH